MKTMMAGLGLCVLVAMGCATSGAAAEAAPSKLRVYVGTYTQGKNNPSKGIYQFALDLKTGQATEPVLAGETTNPSFLAIDADGEHLYAVGEVAEFEGQKTGAVSAFAIDSKTGGLKLINQQSTGGTGPCHVVIDPSGKHVLVANYGSGSCASLSIGSGGKLMKSESVIQHVGSGADPGRQKGPHAHSINTDAAGRFAFVADLGLDQVLVYRLDAASGKLTPNDPPHVKTKPAGGPRHFAFHPTGKFAYVNLEMTSEVTVLTYDAQKGVLNPIQTLSTLPGDFKANNSTAETRVSPDGRFVYVSNRGHDSVAVFRVDAATGKLTVAGHVSTGGKTPRNFNLDPTGQFLIAANQNSASVVLFRIDQETGLPKPTGQSLQVHSPVCIRMTPMR